MQGRNGEIVLGLGGYGTGVAQDTHHLQGEKGDQRMLEIWKIEDQSIDRIEGKHIFPCKYRAILALHRTDANRKTPFQLWNREYGKLPHPFLIFSFF